MTLLITVFAAVFATVKWYGQTDGRWNLAPLCFLYWGAALMWLADAIFEYMELGADYFAPALADMVNDAYLGLSAVALGLVVWLVILLVKDPQGSIRAALRKGKSN